MRKYFVIFIFLFVKTCLHAQTFKLKYFIDFNTGVIDTQFFSTEYPWGRSIPFNGEKGFFSELKNHRVENGSLTLFPSKDTVDYKGLTYNYTTGMLSTKEKFLYGKFEIRCKVTKSKGLWPAFWMWHGNPYCEYDIFEFWGAKPKKYTTGKIWESDIRETNQRTVSIRKKKYTESFHTYSMEWTPDGAAFFEDGKQVFFAEVACNLPMWVFINLALTNDFGSTSKKEKDGLRGFFEIDYLKIYSYVN